MNWGKLKNFICPKCCLGSLRKNAKNDGYVCDCGFFIKEAKFDAIVNKIFQRQRVIPEDPEKNLSELNNL